MESSRGTLGDLFGSHWSLPFHDGCPKGSQEALEDVPGTILETFSVALGSSWGALGPFWLILGRSQRDLGNLWLLVWRSWLRLAAPSLNFAVFGMLLVQFLDCFSKFSPAFANPRVWWPRHSGTCFTDLQSYRHSRTCFDTLFISPVGHSGTCCTYNQLSRKSAACFSTTGQDHVSKHV